MNLTRSCHRSSLSRSRGPVTRAFVRNIADGGERQGQDRVSASGGDEKATRVKRRKNYNPEKIIFSGIQPTGVPHLGNYLGALRQWKQFQDEKTRSKDPKNYKLIYSIVDLHALTHRQSPQELLQRRTETLASLFATGLDAKHSIIYFQSAVNGHSQLMWYLSNVASTGYLSRMTQWKSKLGVSEDATLDNQAAREKLRLGLFSYPVLQAADILLFGADIVPVGEDQQQHVEFARSLARSFNSQYNEANNGYDFFKIPKVLLSPAKRIMSLKDPAVKMSKSHADPASRILITDSPEDIRKKFKSALTDSTEGISYDTANRPGVSNLVEILKHVAHQEASCEEIASDHANQSMRAFKEHVAEETIKILAGFREKFLELMEPNNEEIRDAAHDGRRRAAALAGRQLANIEKLLGLRDSLNHHIQSESSGESSGALSKADILREQELENRLEEEEPDVTPQADQGVDRPIAS